MLVRLLAVVLLAVAVSAQNDTSGEPLLRAIQRGALGDIDRVLNSGANPNVADADGVSALMAATLFGDARTLELLLRHGADPNRAGVSGTTPLMWAMPDEEKVRILLARGANVNARSETGRTPLLVAASYPGTVGVLRLLLDRGADIRAVDAGGASALSLAVRSADVEVVRFLVDRGLDPGTLTPVARRVALARYDLPTTRILDLQRPEPDSRFSDSGFHVAAHSAGRSFDSSGRRREREQRCPVRPNRPADGRHV